MKKAAFTPGPWRIRAKSFCLVESFDGTPVARTLLQARQPYSPYGPMRGGFDDANPVRIANAQLIKSAPELYAELKDVTETLEEILEIIVSGQDLSDCVIACAQDEVDKAVTVLKKARGEI